MRTHWNHIKRFSFLAFLGMTTAGIVHAHHSAAGYNTDLRIEVTGTVTKASFRNPHGKIELADCVSKNYEDGAWEIEAAAANLLRRRGWDFKAVKEGMRLTFVGHPTKDKTRVIYLREIHFEDGTVFGDPTGKDKALD